MDAETSTAVEELTIRLRRSASERWTRSFVPRVREPLDEFLRCFVTMSPMGIVTVVDHIEEELRERAAKALEFAAAHVENEEQFQFAAFIWGPVTAAMLRKAMPTKSGQAWLPDVVAGMTAAGDCTSALVHDELFATMDPRQVLPALVDRIACAYATGVAIV